LVGLLEQPSGNRDCHGQHGHGGAILPDLHYAKKQMKVLMNNNCEL
jgi:hypothetical protein